MNLIEQLFHTLQALFVAIPIDNALGSAYVILNIVSQVFALIISGGSSSGSGGLLGGLFGGGGLF